MSSVANLLREHGLRPSKKRGQHFLIQPATARAIAVSAGLTPDDVVVEIGAGLGALTLELAALASRVIAVEVDRGVFPLLEAELARAGADNVQAILTDALRLDWQALAAQAGRPLKVVGNLPYVISSPLLFELVARRGLWDGATFMLQMELARRMKSGPGSKEYGRLGVMLQVWLEVELGLKVGPNQFYPRPAVESQVVHLRPRTQPLITFADAQEETRFDQVVRAAFGQRRKTLLNSLSGGLNLPREQVTAALERAGVEPRRRAETLTPQDLGRVARELGAG